MIENLNENFISIDIETTEKIKNINNLDKLIKEFNIIENNNNLHLDCESIILEKIESKKQSGYTICTKYNNINQKNQLPNIFFIKEKIQKLLSEENIKYNIIIVKEKKCKCFVNIYKNTIKKKYKCKCFKNNIDYNLLCYTKSYEEKKNIKNNNNKITLKNVSIYNHDNETIKKTTNCQCIRCELISKNINFEDDLLNIDLSEKLGIKITNGNIISFVFNFKTKNNFNKKDLIIFAEYLINGKISQHYHDCIGYLINEYTYNSNQKEKQKLYKIIFLFTNKQKTLAESNKQKEIVEINIINKIKSISYSEANDLNKTIEILNYSFGDYICKHEEILLSSNIKKYYCDCYDRNINSIIKCYKKNQENLYFIFCKKDKFYSTKCSCLGCIISASKLGKIKNSRSQDFIIENYIKNNKIQLIDDTIENTNELNKLEKISYQILKYDLNKNI